MSTQGHDFKRIALTGERSSRVYKETWECPNCGTTKTEESTGPSILFWSLRFRYPRSTEDTSLEHRCDEVRSGRRP